MKLCKMHGACRLGDVGRLVFEHVASEICSQMQLEKEAASVRAECWEKKLEAE